MWPPLGTANFPIMGHLVKFSTNIWSKYNRLADEEIKMKQPKFWQPVCRMAPTPNQPRPQTPTTPEPSPPLHPHPNHPSRPHHPLDHHLDLLDPTTPWDSHHPYNPYHLDPTLGLPTPSPPWPRPLPTPDLHQPPDPTTPTPWPPPTSYPIDPYTLTPTTPWPSSPPDPHHPFHLIDNEWNLFSDYSSHKPEALTLNMRVNMLGLEYTFLCPLPTTTLNMTNYDIGKIYKIWHYHLIEEIKSFQTV